jgi:hypothetical protein
MIRHLLLLLFGRPVVQVMGNVMALAAFLETVMYSRSMGQTVAVGTLGHGLVLVGVAGNTGNLAVLGLAGSESRKDRIMTGSAELRSRGGRVHQFKRLVRLVTGRTVCLSHRRRMRLMTIDALGDGTVIAGMAEITGEGRMLARTGNHLLVGAFVASDTDLLVLTFKADVQRLMRVVATEAVFYFVMDTAFMAVAALGDVVCHARAVPFVTVLATDLRFVGGTVRFDLCRLLAMALDTISNAQNSLLGKRNRTQTSNECQRKSCNQQPLHLILEHDLSSLQKQPDINNAHNDA